MSLADAIFARTERDLRAAGLEPISWGDFLVGAAKQGGFDRIELPMRWIDTNSWGEKRHTRRLRAQQAPGRRGREGGRG